MTPSKRQFNGFWDGFWFMAENYTGRLITLALTVLLIFVVLYGSFSSKYFSKEPIRILEEK
ncbi:MAG: hypothetical protein GY853_01310 [PVC group bacterium]|nr:hypothetical protein [PVC group bacterium]